MADASLAQLAIATESSPGVAESLVLGDVVTKITSAATPEVKVEKVTSDEVTATQSPEVATNGKATFRMGSVVWRLRGKAAPYGTGTTPPATGPLMKAGLFRELPCRLVDTNAVQTFYAGEPITFDNTPTALAICVKTTTTTIGGTLPVAFISDPVPASLGSPEVIRGASGNTCASDGILTGYGYAYLPGKVVNDAAGYHATLQLIADGYGWRGRGCLASTSFGFGTRSHVTVTQEYVGAFSAAGDMTEFAVTSYPETIAPPIAMCTLPKFGGYQPKGLKNVRIEAPVQLDYVEDFGDCNGGILFANGKRLPVVLTCEVDRSDQATKDWETEYRNNGDVAEISFVIGDTSGAYWDFILPKAQLMDLNPSRGDGDRATFQLQFTATRAFGGNDELIIVNRN